MTTKDKKSAAFPDRHLTDCLSDSLQQYVDNLRGQPCTGLYELVMTVAEKEVVAFALRECEGNLTAAAKMLGVSRTTLNNKIAKYGISPRGDGGGDRAKK